MKSAIIKLPADLLGNPDWKYMELHMLHIEQAAKKRLESFTKKI